MQRDDTFRAASPGAGVAASPYSPMERGLAIGPRTELPHWCGERLDLGWASGVLHPACNPGSR